jgi:hypothetical protein
MKDTNGMWKLALAVEDTAVVEGVPAAMTFCAVPNMKTKEGWESVYCPGPTKCPI